MTTNNSKSGNNSEFDLTANSIQNAAKRLFIIGLTHQNVFEIDCEPTFALMVEMLSYGFEFKDFSRAIFICRCITKWLDENNKPFQSFNTSIICKYDWYSNDKFTPPKSFKELLK